MDKLFAGPNSLLDSVGRYGSIICLVAALFFLWKRQWPEAAFFGFIVVTVVIFNAQN